MCKFGNCVSERNVSIVMEKLNGYNSSSCTGLSVSTFLLVIGLFQNLRAWFCYFCVQSQHVVSPVRVLAQVARVFCKLAQTAQVLCLQPTWLKSCARAGSSVLQAGRCHGWLSG